MASSFTYPSAPTNQPVAHPGNVPAVNVLFKMGNLLRQRKQEESGVAFPDNWNSYLKAMNTLVSIGYPVIDQWSATNLRYIGPAIAPIIIAANTAPETAPEQLQEMRQNAEERRQEREGSGDSKLDHDGITSANKKNDEDDDDDPQRCRVEKMKAKDLKAELVQYGLDSSGVKAILQERLLAHLHQL